METQTESNSVIHRKARVARDEFDARAMSPSKALRLSLEKAADRLFALALTVGTVEQVVQPHAALADEVGDDGLLVLLDGRDGARGAVKLDLAFLTALVEVQIKGRVTQGEAEPRPVTRTDAAMAAQLIDALLGGMDAQMAGAMPDHRDASFRFGDRVEDARSMGLALEAPDYDVFRLTADIGQGAKTGVISVILPKLPEVQPLSRDEAGENARAFDLKELAMNAPVTLDAVVARLWMPLEKICALKPGACVPVDMAALAETELVGAKGHVVARVKLGQLNGFRAVRLIRDGVEDDPADQPAETRAETANLQKIGALSAEWAPEAEAPAQQTSAPDMPDGALPDLTLPDGPAPGTEGEPPPAMAGGPAPAPEALPSLAEGLLDEHPQTAAVQDA